VPFQTNVDTRQRTSEEPDRDVLATSGDRRAEAWLKENAEAIAYYNDSSSSTGCRSRRTGCSDQPAQRRTEPCRP
jgi:hypothetical protein